MLKLRNGIVERRPLLLVLRKTLGKHRRFGHDGLWRNGDFAAAPAPIVVLIAAIELRSELTE